MQSRKEMDSGMTRRQAWRPRFRAARGLRRRIGFAVATWQRQLPEPFPFSALASRAELRLTGARARAPSPPGAAAMAAAARKILLSGDVDGKLKALFKRAEQVRRRSIPSPLLAHGAV